MRYVVVIERAGANFSAYVPDLPGCVATGRTIREAQKRVSEAVAFHIEGMTQDGERPPRPAAKAAYIDALPLKPQQNRPQPRKRRVA